jgi:pectate lyase
MILNHYSMVKEQTNVIIRNLGVHKVVADNGDAIAVREYNLLKDICLGNR